MLVTFKFKTQATSICVNVCYPISGGEPLARVRPEVAKLGKVMLDHFFIKEPLQELP